MLLWFDLESTDLHPRTCAVLEVAAVLTDYALTEVEGTRYESLVYPRGGLTRTWEAMLPIVRDMHTTSGLWDALKVGPLKHLADVESDLLDLLLDCDAVTLAGNGVGHFDHHVITYQMPRLAKQLTYYDMDISVLRRFSGDVAGRADIWRPREPIAHRAMADVQDSLADARHLRAWLGVPPL